MNEGNSVLKTNYFSGMTIAYLPCDKLADYEVTEGIPGNAYEVDPECVTDPNIRKDYLDSSKWGYYQTYLYYNFEYFDSEQFGDDAV